MAYVKVNMYSIQVKSTEYWNDIHKKLKDFLNNCIKTLIFLKKLQKTTELVAYILYKVQYSYKYSWKS